MNAQSYGLPTGHTDATQVTLSPSTLRVAVWGGFSVPVFVMWLSPDQYAGLMSGRAYTPTASFQGTQFSFEWTAPWPGLWNLVVYNYNQPYATGTLNIELRGEPSRWLRQVRRI